MQNNMCYIKGHDLRYINGICFNIALIMYSNTHSVKGTEYAVRCAWRNSTNIILNK